MATEICPVCRKPLGDCPYNGDCGEVQTIYRERQRELRLDIEPEDGTCMVCSDKLAADDERWAICGFCRHEIAMDEATREDD